MHSAAHAPTVASMRTRRSERPIVRAEMYARVYTIPPTYARTHIHDGTHSESCCFNYRANEDQKSVPPALTVRNSGILFHISPELKCSLLP
eukprot:2993345-Pleurochrysis_carterae.AAC.1